MYTVVAFDMFAIENQCAICNLPVNNQTKMHAAWRTIKRRKHIDCELMSLQSVHISKCNISLHSKYQSQWRTIILSHELEATCTSPKCAVPENIHTHPKDGHLKFRGGWGSQLHKFLKESMKVDWKSQGVGGSKPKNHPWGRYGYFLEPHNGINFRN